MKDQPGDNPGEFVLLALVVGVMSAVKAEAACAGQVADPEITMILGRLPTPNPGLTPDQVVKIQLSAFKINDAADQGVRKAYDFASPASKRVAGPVERFAVLVRNPVYLPLLNFNLVQFGSINVIGEDAEQHVSVTSSQGVEFNYLFRLSRQAIGEFSGCWMTDRLEPV